MNKIKLLQIEIDYLKNTNYKKDLEKIINLLPDYFFTIPASSTGKYHPGYALNEGGLLRHTKAAAKIGHELLYGNDTMGKYFTNNQKDLMIFALIIHDGLKSGVKQEKYTRFDHPLLISNLIKENKNNLSLNDEEINLLTSSIETHMGQWNINYKGSEELEKPSNSFQNFVHMCDFLASRKFLEVLFKDNEIDI